MLYVVFFVFFFALLEIGLTGEAAFSTHYSCVLCVAILMYVFLKY